MHALLIGLPKLWQTEIRRSSGTIEETMDIGHFLLSFAAALPEPLNILRVLTTELGLPGNPTLPNSNICSHRTVSISQCFANKYCNVVIHKHTFHRETTCFPISYCEVNFTNKQTSGWDADGADADASTDTEVQCVFFMTGLLAGHFLAGTCTVNKKISHISAHEFLQAFALWLACREMCNLALLCPGHMLKAAALLALMMLQYSYR